MCAVTGCRAGVTGASANRVEAVHLRSLFKVFRLRPARSDDLMNSRAIDAPRRAIRSKFERLLELV